MSDKKTKEKAASKKYQERVWVNPNSTFKGPLGNRGWDQRLSCPDGARMLELADIALGSAPPAVAPVRKKKAVA